MIIDVETIEEEFSHEKKRKYDPIKRREYYLKTRKLKGRKGSMNYLPPVKIVKKTDPIGDTVRNVGNAFTYVKNKTVEGVKDAKLTLDVLRLQATANQVRDEIKKTKDPGKNFLEQLFTQEL